MGQVLPATEAADLCRKARADGRKIVFTNGCFDLLHPGHVHSLEQARKLGDVLVVGLNSDASVKNLKGPGRPFVAEAGRAKLLAALACVDIVCLFDEDTPAALLEAIQPDVLVKGAEYSDREVVGAESVRDRGGAVVLVDELPGYSTSALIKKIVEAQERDRN
jgi:D-beta-D-heptose 7-phosphate kinase/D-beta-D-heptose 1-phosphate adenosyltransferase